MSVNGKLTLAKALESLTKDDLDDLDASIEKKQGEIDALVNERAALIRLREIVATKLGFSAGVKRAVNADGLHTQIERLLRAKGPLTIAEIAAACGRKDGGVRLAVRKKHYKFTIVDGDRIGLAETSQMEGNNADQHS